MDKFSIGKKDVFWSYVATLLKIGVGVILLPFILRVFPQETVAIWMIFSTIIALTSLLDFGFNPAFARNVSYVVSGVKELKSTGYQIVGGRDAVIDYGIFKGLINAMRWFYARMALLLFVLLITAGTYYIYTVLQNYTGNHNEVYVSWIILCTVNAYSLYTYYYDALMQGRGLIKRANQIQAIAYVVYLTVAAILILLRFNLIAIVSAQTLMVIIKRALSYYTVYTVDFKKQLNSVNAKEKRDFIKPILPNAVKFGLVGVSAFVVRRSSIIIGSLFLTLNDIASYGITIQIVTIIYSVAGVYINTYLPQVAQYRIHDNTAAIKHLYLRSCGYMLLTFIVCGIALLFFGDWALELIKSETPLLPQSFIIAALLVYLLDANQSIAGSILVSKNEIPFFKSSLYTGGLMMFLLFVFLKYLNLGLWSLILAHGISQMVYANWKWPLVVIKEFSTSNSHE